MHLTSLILLAALWYVLTGGDPSSWGVGLPSIGAALAARHHLRPFPPSKPSLGGAVRFLAGFLRVSFVSGIDVVRRAFHPKLPLHPGLISHELRAVSPLSRILTTGTVSLLPGTLSVQLQHAQLTVHVLDLDAPVRKELQHIEALVAGMLPAAPTAGAPGVGGGHE